jgi:hypothetical protein
MRYLIQASGMKYTSILDGIILSHDYEKIESTDLKFENCILSTHDIYYLYCDVSFNIRNIRSKSIFKLNNQSKYSDFEKMIDNYKLSIRINKLKKICL